MDRDIFKGDKKIDSSHGDSFIIPLRNIGKGIKILFSRKFYMNLFLFLLILGGGVGLTFFFYPESETICPNISCS
jgi:hypothetical protein